MTREQVTALIGAYRENCARAEFLGVREDELNAIIEDLRKHAAYYATSTTPAYTGMPGGGPVESKVERIAITLAEGKLPGELADAETELYEVREERRRFVYSVRCVEAWMKVLNPRERLIITEHCLNGRVWRETVNMFNDRFGEDYTKAGLKAVMERGIDRIIKIAV